MLGKEVLFAVFVFAAICHGERHLRFEKENVGSLTVTTSVRDLQAFAPGIVKSPDSICSKGLWLVYSEPDYNGTVGSYPIQNQWSDEVCLMGKNFGSILQVGPDADAYDGKGLILFSEETFEGETFEVRKPANAHLPFVPRSLLVTGEDSKWTLYTGTNFNGTASCYGGYKYYKVNKLSDDVKSVAFGCR